MWSAHFGVRRYQTLESISNINTYGGFIKVYLAFAVELCFEEEDVEEDDDDSVPYHWSMMRRDEEVSF